MLEHNEISFFAKTSCSPLNTYFSLEFQAQIYKKRDVEKEKKTTNGFTEIVFFIYCFLRTTSLHKNVTYRCCFRLNLMKKIKKFEIFPYFGWKKLLQPIQKVLNFVIHFKL